MAEGRSIPVARATASVKPPYDSHFEKRALAQSARYERDEADLMPQPTKSMPTGSLPVELADAATVRVKKRSPGPTVFHATKKPKLFFNGNVTVADYEEAEEQTDDATAVADATTAPVTATSTPEASPVQAVTIDKVVGKRAKKVAVHVDDEPTAADATSPVSARTSGRRQVTPTSTPATSLSVQEVDDFERKVAIDQQARPLRNPHGIVSMQRARISDRNPQGGTLRVAAPVQPTTTITPSTWWPVPIAIACGLAIAFVLFGLEVTVEMAAEEFHAQYSYNWLRFGANLGWWGE